MKLGIYTNIFYNKTFEEALDSAKDFGLNAIEIGAGNFAGTKFCNPAELLKDKDAIKDFKKKIESRGLLISALNCAGNPLHPDKMFADAHVHDLKDAMQLASKIGVKIINVFAGCPGGDKASTVPNWITCPWPPYYADAIKWQWDKKILPFWNEMAKKAKKLSIKFGFEMHPGDSVYNPETLLMLREKIGMEEISCNFDPSHLFWQGVDSIVAIKCLGKAIIHVHAKDTKIEKSVVEYRGILDWKPYSNILDRAWTFRTIGYGHGEKFWKDFFCMLRIIGYDGVISIEHEDPIISPEEGLSKAIRFLKEVIMFEAAAEMWWA